MARIANLGRVATTTLALLASARDVSTKPFGQALVPSAERQAQRPLEAAARSAIQADPAGAVAGFIALGDSYSAGIGTGTAGAEVDCRLGLHAYPALIYADLFRGSPNAPSFQWRSCTGATANSLLYSQGQIASLDRLLPADFATLSIGGNDLGFFQVINACVFRFYSVGSGTCEQALERAALLVASPDFELRLQVALLELLNLVRWERHPRFAVVVTGYARFFDAATKACDDASLGVWWGGPKLSTALRTEMNSLVLAANVRLRRTVEHVNAHFSGTRPKALFVDYDGAFEGHRFCEPGVSEPDYSRNDTWFFLVGGPDNGHNLTVAPHAKVLPPPLTSADPSPCQEAQHCRTPRDSLLVDPRRCLKPARESGDWGLLAMCYMAMAKQRDPTLRTAHSNIISQENDGWYVPTSYGKVFHPRSLGHEAIRDSIYREWKRVFDEDLIQGK